MTAFPCFSGVMNCVPLFSPPLLPPPSTHFCMTTGRSERSQPSEYKVCVLKIISMNFFHIPTPPFFSTSLSGRLNNSNLFIRAELMWILHIKVCLQFVGESMHMWKVFIKAYVAAKEVASLEIGKHVWKYKRMRWGGSRNWACWTSRVGSSLEHEERRRCRSEHTRILDETVNHRCTTWVTQESGLKSGENAFSFVAKLPLCCFLFFFFLKIQFQIKGQSCFYNKR